MLWFHLQALGLKGQSSKDILKILIICRIITLSRIALAWLETSCAWMSASAVRRSSSSAADIVNVTRELWTEGLRRLRRVCASDAWITVRCFSVLLMTVSTSVSLSTNNRRFITFHLSKLMHQQVHQTTLIGDSGL